MKEKRQKSRRGTSRKREPRLRTQVHITRITALLLQVGLTLLLFDFLRNYFFLVLTVVEGGILLLSLLSAFGLSRRLELKLMAPAGEIQKDEEGYVRLVLQNPTIFASMEVVAELKTENTFYRNKGKTNIFLPCHRGEVQQDLPVRFTNLGNYHFDVDIVTVKDFLGIVNFRKKMGTSCEITVFPAREKEEGDFRMTDLSGGMTESEETTKKGHDFSDVSDVREYIPGDKLNSIHWKLTAKRDILMVKDRVSMSDQQMIILTELSGTPRNVDEILSLTDSVLRDLIADQIDIRLLWWSVRDQKFQEREIASPDNLREAFSDIYYETIYKDPDLTRTLMQSVYPERKAYVNIRLNPEGEADAVIQEQN